MASMQPWSFRAALLLLLVLLLVPSRAAADGKSWVPDFLNPRSDDRKEAKKLAPVPLDKLAARPAEGEARAIRVRIYTDADYRGGVLHWQQKSRALIERINELVGRAFNVRFEIESLRSWPQSHTGLTIERILTEVEALDPAREVDWVIGLVTAFKGVATSIHQVGGARLLARHFVLRGMDDQEEGRRLKEILSMLPLDERERLYEQRKAHKEVIVFLHEWAHTMGVMHIDDPAQVMNPLYDNKQSDFTDFQRRQIALVIDKRLTDRDRLYPESAELLPLLKEAPSREGTDHDRAALLQTLTARAAGGGGLVAASTGPAGANVLPIPAADVELFNQAVAAINQKQLEQAWTVAAPLFTRHAGQPKVLELSCMLVAGQPQAQTARQTCDAAIKLEPTNASLRMEAAAAYLGAGEPLQAAPLVMAAAPLVSPGADNEAKLIRLARIATGAGALSVADASLAKVGKHTKDSDEAAEALDATRRNVGLPRSTDKSGVNPDDEPTFVSTYWELAEVKGPEKKSAAYRARLAEFQKRYPGAPGVLVLTCEADLRAGRLPAATKACQAAVATYADATRAHLLLGVMAANAGRTDAAEKSFRRAILLDPADGAAWDELANLYRSTHATQKLKQLSSEHETLLSRPLTAPAR